MAAALDALFLGRYGQPVRGITGQAQAGGVRNAYDTAEQLGADSWAAMLGLAQHAKSQPLLLASFGTATTLDTLGSERPAGSTNESQGNLVFYVGLILHGPAPSPSAPPTSTANQPEA